MLPFIIDGESHTDHSIPESTKDWVYALISKEVSEMGKGQVLVLTKPIQPWAEPLPCVLHGPLVGEDPVPEGEVYYDKRGGREGVSRMTRRPPGQTRVVTVIVGWFGDWPRPKLFTIYPGPSAPRDTWDPSLSATERLESQSFWKDHALSVERKP